MAPIRLGRQRHCGVLAIALVLDCVVDSEHGHLWLIHEFGMKEVASKWTAPNTVDRGLRDVGDCHNWPTTRRLAKHLQERRSQQVLSQSDGFPALAAEGVGLVEHGGDAALF
jgi:hypothetical protein